LKSKNLIKLLKILVPEKEKLELKLELTLNLNISASEALLIILLVETQMFINRFSSFCKKKN